MSERINSRKPELGQVIPLIALMMIAIVGMAALIIDGGSLMSNRRTAQAAADAAALAGAKSLCTGNESGAISVAHNYAITKNKATTSVETIVASVDINGHSVKGIKVDTTISNPSFFAGIFGQSTLNAKATATAGCYHPSITTHLLPIAFYYNQPPIKSDSADCTDLSKPCDIINWDYTTLFSTLGSTAVADLPLNNIYVIMNDVKICAKTVSGPIVCNAMAGNPEGGNRAWVDLTQLAVGSNLKQIIKNGVSKPLSLPSWLNGEPGVVAAVYDDRVYTLLPPIEGYESLPYRLVLVPVFDYFCQYGNPDVRCPDKWTAGDTTEYIVNVNQPSYRLVGLAPFVITCVTKNQSFDYGVSVPKNTGVNKTNKPQCPGYASYLQGLSAKDTPQKDAIEGYFVEGSPLDQFTSGTEGVGVGLDIISLTK